MTKLAIVFPGQGSQFVGMGQDVHDRYSSVQALFTRANDILGRDIRSICFEGPEDVLLQTDNAQAGIFLVSVALYEQIKEAGITPDIVAGHSLGELTACYAAGVINFDTALQLVVERGRLMAVSAAASSNTGMAAILGLDGARIKLILDAYDAHTVVVANYNSDAQTVISGDVDGIAAVTELLKEAGAKRIIPLKVGGAFHSPYMANASVAFSEFLAGFDFSEPQLPIVLNRSAAIAESGEVIRDNLPLQIQSSVRWSESLAVMHEVADTFIECGPGQVLTGLIKKQLNEVTSISVNDADSLETALSQLVVT